jgi:hypothetical protein
VAIEHAGDASALTGSTGTEVPFPLPRVLVPAGVTADEPARPGVQPAQTTTSAATSAAAASEPPARDAAARNPMPRWYARFTVRDPRRRRCTQPASPRSIIRAGRSERAHAPSSTIAVRAESAIRSLTYWTNGDAS